MISFIRFRLITGCGWIDYKKKRSPVLQDKPGSTETAAVAGLDRQDNFTVYEKCSNLKLLNHGGC